MLYRTSGIIFVFITFAFFCTRSIIYLNLHSMHLISANQSIFTNPKFPGMAEMVTYLPISSPFIRFAGRYVDEAFGVAAGYNFFVFEAMLVPFEIVACNVIIHYWSDAVPVGGIIAIVIVLYG